MKMTRVQTLTVGAGLVLGGLIALAFGAPFLAGVAFAGIGMIGATWAAHSFWRRATPGILLMGALAGAAAGGAILGTVVEYAAWGITKPVIAGAASTAAFVGGRLPADTSEMLDFAEGLEEEADARRRYDARVPDARVTPPQPDDRVPRSGGFIHALDR